MPAADQIEMQIDPLRLIDSHCHLDDPRFQCHPGRLLAAAQQVGVSDIVLPATTAASWPGIAEIAKNHPGVHAAYGLHPWFVDHHGDEAINRLSRWLEGHPAVAIGECGLDFSRDNMAAQQQLFAGQIELAQQIGLPLIVHAHRSLDKVIQCLRGQPGINGVVHRFAGSRQQAEQLIERGFLIGVAAGITYPANKKLRCTMAALPLETLLLESDAPDLPPQGAPTDNAPEINRPEWLPVTLTALAELLDESPAEIARRTTINSRRLFNI